MQLGLLKIKPTTPTSQVRESPKPSPRRTHCKLEGTGADIENLFNTLHEPSNDPPKLGCNPLTLHGTLRPHIAQIARFSVDIIEQSNIANIRRSGKGSSSSKSSQGSRSRLMGKNKNLYICLLINCTVHIKTSSTSMGL